MAGRRRFSRLLAGQDEAILSVLPETVLANLHRPSSENALVWNLIYRIAQPALSLHTLLAIGPLWGTADQASSDDLLQPFFWGYNVSGQRLELLDKALDDVDGPGRRTEVDLFLLGATNLVLAEAKHLGGFGHCSRYVRRRCPEIHRDNDAYPDPCRYWSMQIALFSRLLEVGPRPGPGSREPPCSRHYQLARTLLLGQALADLLERQLHVWVLTPRRRWRALESAWLDFVDRARSDEIWRRLRVIAWEDLAALAAR